MASTLRSLPRAAFCAARPLRALTSSRSLSHFRPLLAATPHQQLPREPRAPLAGTKPAQVILGTAKRLPEFNLGGKVVLVSGAGRGLGLVQAEALLEAGATGLSMRASILPLRMFLSS